MKSWSVFAFAVSLCAQTNMEPGKPIQGEASARQARSYSIQLKPGQYLHTVLHSIEADVTVALNGPNGETLITLATDDFPNKTVSILWIAEIPGVYRVEVKAGTIATHYEVKLEELRPASARDRKRAEAERLFSQAPAETVKYNYKAAVDLYERASILFRETRDRAGEEAALHHLGLSYHDLDGEEQALHAYQEALKIAQDVKDQRGQGRILVNMGNAYSHLGQQDKAIDYYRQATELFRAAGDRRREILTLFNLGAAYEQTGRFQEAAKAHEQTLSFARERGDRMMEGRALQALGWVNFSFGNYDKSIGYDQQALLILRELKDRQSEGWTLLNLGIVYHETSRFENAFRNYEEALRAVREANDRRGEAAVLLNIGRVNDDLGQYEKSVAFYEQALSILREIKDRGREAVALTDLAATYRDLKENQRALECDERALSIIREVKDRGFEVITLKEIGLIYADLGQPRKAIEYYDQARAIVHEINSTGNSEVPNALGAAYRKLGESEKAAAYYTQALAASRETKNLGEESAALTGLMELSREAGRQRLAIFYGKQAINTLQSLRTSIRSLDRDLQKSFLTKNEKPYHALAELLIAQGRLAEAEQVLGFLKQEEYFEYIRRDAAEGSALEGRASLTQEEAEWEKRYREFGGRLMAIGVEHGELLAKQSRNPSETRRLAQLDQDLQAGNIAFEKFLGELTQHFSAQSEATLRVEEIHETQGFMEDLRDLPAGAVAIYTIVGPEKFHAILRTPDAQKAYEFPISEKDLNRKVAEFREVVGDPKLDPRPLAEELYRIVVGPMAEDLRQANAKTLMWSLDGVLRYLPLAALYDGREYLIEQYGISVMTLASSPRLKDRPDNQWRMAGFGVTKGYGDSGPLPSVAAELTAIRAILPGEIMLDDKFTEASLRETLRKRYPVVHIASHFRFLPGDESKSFLLLGDGTHLSLQELRTLPNLFGGVQLLTLSACNTALGDGTEVESFGTLAQRQGAKAVIASLWSVADTSTSRTMQEFYRIREASPGITKAEALREAQLELLRGAKGGSEQSSQAEPSSGEVEKALPKFTERPEAPYAHPYYWAPFFLMGNWL